MKLKGFHFVGVSGIHRDVTEELNKAQKEEFSAAFQKMYDRAKSCMYIHICQWSLF
jgi:hypothetical protein